MFSCFMTLGSKILRTSQQASSSWDMFKQHPSFDSLFATWEADDYSIITGFLENPNFILVAQAEMKTIRKVMRVSIRNRIAIFNAILKPAPLAPPITMVTPAPVQSINRTSNPSTTLEKQVEPLRAQMNMLLNSIQKSQIKPIIIAVDLTMERDSTAERLETEHKEILELLPLLICLSTRIQSVKRLLDHLHLHFTPSIQ